MRFTTWKVTLWNMIAPSTFRRNQTSNLHLSAHTHYPKGGHHASAAGEAGTKSTETRAFSTTDNGGAIYPTPHNPALGHLEM